MSLSLHWQQQVRMARIAVAVIALAAGGGVGYWWFGVQQPSLERAESDMLAQENRLKQMNTTTRRAILDFGNSGIKEALDGARAQRETFARMIPRADSTETRLLSRVTEAARAKQLRVGELRPLPEKVTGDGFIERGYQAKLVGPYHTVAAVLSGLLNFERVTHVRKVTIEGVPPRILGDSASGDAVIAGGTDYLKKVAAVLGKTTGPWNVEATFEVVEVYSAPPALGGGNNTGPKVTTPATQAKP